MAEPSFNVVGGVSVLGLASPILSVEHLMLIDHRIGSLAEGSPCLPLVIVSEHPRIFLAGAHLREIANLDHCSSDVYARRGRAVINRIASFPSATVAAVDGPCAGGGLDLVLACDRVVAGPRARFSHPGARRGLVTGWGGTTRLPLAVGSACARRHLLEATDLGERSLRQMETVTCNSADLRSVAINEARGLDDLEDHRLELWRALKSGRFIDRFRIFVLDNL